MRAAAREVRRRRSGRYGDGWHAPVTGHSRGTAGGRGFATGGRGALHSPPHAPLHLWKAEANAPGIEEDAAASSVELCSEASVDACCCCCCFCCCSGPMSLVPTVVMLWLPGSKLCPGVAVNRRHSAQNREPRAGVREQPRTAVPCFPRWTTRAFLQKHGRSLRRVRDSSRIHGSNRLFSQISLRHFMCPSMM